MSDRIRVEVVYALAATQALEVVELDVGSSARQAIEVSGLCARFPEIASEPLVGIYGERVTLDAVVNDGDRVEIYRSLKADPKETRRRRSAARAKKRL